MRNTGLNSQLIDAFSNEHILCFNVHSSFLLFVGMNKKCILLNLNLAQLRTGN